MKFPAAQGMVSGLPDKIALKTYGTSCVRGSSEKIEIGAGQQLPKKAEQHCADDARTGAPHRRDSTSAPLHPCDGDGSRPEGRRDEERLRVVAREGQRHDRAWRYVVLAFRSTPKFSKLIWVTDDGNFW